MGDAADDVWDKGYEEYYESFPLNIPNNYQSRAGRNKWRTAEDKIINISDMTEAHIRNAISFCIKFNNKSKLRELRDEIDKRNGTEDDGYIDFLKRIGEY